MNYTTENTIAVGAPGSAMNRIMTPAEPTEQHTVNYHTRTHTPWGTADSAEYFGKGLIRYGTPGHGGFHVSAGLLKRIPDYLQTADGYADGTKGWFEEDCAWAIVAVCLPEYFSFKDREHAVRTMQSTYPKQWEQFCRF